MTIRNALGDINMIVWESIPLDIYDSPKNKKQLKESMKKVHQTQSFISRTVISPMWDMALKFTLN